MKHVTYALSIKQPWAALIVVGIKKIEIRRWWTKRRGRVLIHAARISDSRKEGWSLVPPELHQLAAYRGGVIGAAELTECVSYESLEQFIQDRALHRNEPEWFRPPQMYGFRFSDPERLPFQRVKGNVRFFRVTALPRGSAHG